MNVLVLGGSVFVGRHLVDALVRDGHRVSVLNRGHTPSALPPDVEQLVADRTNPDQMHGALARREWDAVFDVSGFVMAAGGSDIAGLIDLLDGRTGRYVFVSSIMAYDQGLAGRFPWTEDMPTNPDGPASYGGFKAAAETEMLARHASTGFPAVVVRPAAIYGPDNNIFDMETPMFLRLLQGRPILVPHGGLVVGSYGHVDDLCDALTVLGRHPDAAGHVVNVSTDAVDVNRYIATLASIVGATPHVVHVPDSLLASIETPVFGHLFKVRHHAMLDLTKMRSFGITPRFDLVAGHRATYEWFVAKGWDRLDGPLADPVWKASWDFDAEARCAERMAHG